MRFDENIEAVKRFEIPTRINLLNQRIGELRAVAQEAAAEIQTLVQQRRQLTERRKALKEQSA